MGKRLLLVFLSFMLHQIIEVDGSLTFADVVCADDNRFYSEGSIYQHNLNNLLSSLSSQASHEKFYNFSVGDVPNKVYGLYQCREDLSLQVCDGCIGDATRRIITMCPLISEAIAWYEECTLRYANRSIFSLSEVSPFYRSASRLNVSNYDQFAAVLSGTMGSLINDATTSSLSTNFATREANVTSVDKLYCLAQCTTDISGSQCGKCLQSALAAMRACCRTRIDVMIFMPSCTLIYGPSLFYNATYLAMSAVPKNQRKKMKPSIIAGIAVAATIGLGLILICLYLCWNKPRKGYSKKLNQLREDDKNSLGDSEFFRYDLATIRAATGDFSPGNELGKGAFGAVYKGTLNSGQEIAVKRLFGRGTQGEEEFMLEASVLSRLQHRNLVKLLGFCCEAGESLLVYELMPNTSLDGFLNDPSKKTSLNWNLRYKIILGIAKGLKYLHEDSRLMVVHRDLKTPNILLDGDMTAKIADFGIAKLIGVEEQGGITSRIAGTFGYMAPEYALTGEFSNKSDVYSFGIVLLEIISGLKNLSRRDSSSEVLNLPEQVWKLWNEQRSFELADASLYNSCSRSELMRFIQIGMLCVQGNADDRPTMGKVVLMLTGSATLPSPSSPSMSFGNQTKP